MSFRRRRVFHVHPRHALMYVEVASPVRELITSRCTRAEGVRSGFGPWSARRLGRAVPDPVRRRLTHPATIGWHPPRDVRSRDQHESHGASGTFQWPGVDLRCGLEDASPEDFRPRFHDEDRVARRFSNFRLLRHHHIQHRQSR
jgi:hypothetical protein